MLTKAIVLSKHPFGEADQYIQFLTEDCGVVTALAKAARKSKRRYVGGLDLFCHDEILIRGNPRGHAYLTELTVLTSFPELRTTLDRLLSAGKIVHWTRQLIADYSLPIPLVYELLIQFLSLMGHLDLDQLQACEVSFQFHLLERLGLKPRLDACSKCDNKTQSATHFDIALGGVICPSCMPQRVGSFSTEIETLKHLSTLSVNHLSTLPALPNLPRISRLLTDFAYYHATSTRMPTESLGSYK